MRFLCAPRVALSFRASQRKTGPPELATQFGKTWPSDPPPRDVGDQILIVQIEAWFRSYSLCITAWPCGRWSSWGFGVSSQFGLGPRPSASPMGSVNHPSETRYLNGGQKCFEQVARTVSIAAVESSDLPEIRTLIAAAISDRVVDSERDAQTLIALIDAAFDSRGTP